VDQCSPRNFSLKQDISNKIFQKGKTLVDFSNIDAKYYSLAEMRNLAIKGFLPRFYEAGRSHLGRKKITDVTADSNIKKVVDHVYDTYNSPTTLEEFNQRTVQLRLGWSDTLKDNNLAGMENRITPYFAFLKILKIRTFLIRPKCLRI
jgi:hypothetical protein